VLQYGKDFMSQLAPVYTGGETSHGRVCHSVRARSYCRFVLPLIHFIQGSLAHSAPLFLKRQCDRTLHSVPISIQVCSKIHTITAVSERV
jgi:hypothetical protein